jgi:hypothetical protein
LVYVKLTELKDSYVSTLKIRRRRNERFKSYLDEEML